MDNLNGPGFDEQPQNDHKELEDPLDLEYLDGSEDNNNLPPSEEEVSLGDEDFIVAEDPLEQARFKRELIGTARSMKKQQQK